MPTSKPALVDSKEPLEDLLEHSPYAIFIHDLKNIVMVNHTFLGLFEYALKENVIGKPAIETLVFHEDVKIVKKTRELIKDGNPFFIPAIRLVKNDGSVFLAEAHISTATFENKAHLRVFVRDITQSQNSEIKLLESGKKYTALFENSLDGLYKSTPSGKFVEVNPALVDMLGYSSTEELLALDIKTQLYFEIKDRKMMSEHKQSRYPLKKKDGSRIWVEDHSYYEYDEHGNIVFQNGIVRDVTEKLQEQKELRNLLDVTKDQNKRLQNFAHIVSHNIRSHSSNLSALVGLLKDNENEKEKAYLFDMLKTSTIKLEDTIRNLNEIITINQNQNQPFEFRNLKNEISSTLKALKGGIIQNEIEVSVEIPSDLEIKVVSTYLDSILLNVISNAIKYHSQDIESFIDIKAGREEDYWILYVSDNGLGIDLKKNANKLFGMYETFHNDQDTSGFGLYITKNQIEAMNGKIEVKSKLGEGSTFKIFFPVVQ